MRKSQFWSLHLLKLSKKAARQPKARNPQSSHQNKKKAALTQICGLLPNKNVRLTIGHTLQNWKHVDGRFASTVDMNWSEFSRSSPWPTKNSLCQSKSRWPFGLIRCGGRKKSRNVSCYCFCYKKILFVHIEIFSNTTEIWNHSSFNSKQELNTLRKYNKRFGLK